MEIKLPVKWLNEKGISIENGDVYEIKYAESKTSLGSVFSLNRGEVSQRYSPPSKDSVIISFGWRGDTSIMNLVAPIEVMDCPPQATAKWKPDAKALMEMYTAEQSAKSWSELPPETKKETKLKLTKDDVGKEFENQNGAVYTVRLVNQVNVSIESTSGNYYSCHFDGVFHEGVCVLIKRHEPRYWLKDLPDADLFIEGVLSIHFDAAQRWAVTYFDGHGHWLPYAGLPMLDDENIAISLISIDDLREWQRVNK